MTNKEILKSIVRTEVANFDGVIIETPKNPLLGSLPNVGDYVSQHQIVSTNWDSLTGVIRNVCHAWFPKYNTFQGLKDGFFVQHLLLPEPNTPLVWYTSGNSKVYYPYRKYPNHLLWFHSFLNTPLNPYYNTVWKDLYFLWGYDKDNTRYPLAIVFPYKFEYSKKTLMNFLIMCRYPQDHNICPFDDIHPLVSLPFWNGGYTKNLFQPGFNITGGHSFLYSVPYEKYFMGLLFKNQLPMAPFVEKTDWTKTFSQMSNDINHHRKFKADNPEFKDFIKKNAKKFWDSVLVPLEEKTEPRKDIFGKVVAAKPQYPIPNTYEECHTILLGIQNYLKKEGVTLYGF